MKRQCHVWIYRITKTGVRQTDAHPRRSPLSKNKIPQNKNFHDTSTATACFKIASTCPPCARQTLTLVEKISTIPQPPVSGLLVVRDPRHSQKQFQHARSAVHDVSDDSSDDSSAETSQDDSSAETLHRQSSHRSCETCNRHTSQGPAEDHKHQSSEYPSFPYDRDAHA